MRTRSMGPMAGFGWLARAINLGHRNAKAVFGGAALLMLASLLPSLLTLPLQLGGLRAGSPPSPGVFAGVMLFSMAAGLLLVPLFAGYLRLIDGAEQGRAVRAMDVFAPYREGQVLRLVGYGVAMLGVYLGMLALVLAAAGGGLARWYWQLITAQGGAPAPSGLPPGLGIALLLLGVLGLLMMGVYAISLGQVALRGRSVPGAIGDGFAGALRNLLPLLVLALAAVLAWLLVALLFVVVVVVASLLAKAAGAWLLVVVLVPMYVALMLALYVVMFGTMYFLWRDVCGGDAVPPAGAPQALAA